MALILACVLSMAAHAPSFGPSFVWDDRILIDDPRVQELRPPGDYFTSSFWSPSDTSPDLRMYFRPLSTLSLAVDHHLHGERTTGYHLTNLVLHGLCVLLVFLVALRLGASSLSALLGALFLGWFPRASESVDWISGRTDLLATLPALAALLVTMSRLSARRWLAATLVLAALLAKEVGLAAVAGVTVYELLQKGPLGARARRLVPLALALAAFVFMRVRAIDLVLSRSGLTIGTRAVAGLEAIARYAWMLLDAWHPQLQIGSPVHPSLGFVVAGALLLGASSVLAGLWLLGKLRVREEIVALLVTAAGSIALVLHVLPIHVNVVAADRFLYLPVACLGAVLGAALEKLRATRWRRHSTWLAAALVFSYLPATVARAAVWGDDLRFWTTAAREQRGEQNAMSRVGLGNVLAEHGLYEDALRAFSTARPLDARNYILARHNWAGVLAVQGRVEEACALTERTLELFHLPGLYTKLATLRASLNQVPLARESVGRYAELVTDPKKVAEARREVELAVYLGEELRRTGGPQKPDDAVLGTDLEARLERVRTLLRLQINDVAFKEAAPLLEDRRVGASRAQHLLLLAIEHAGPDELMALHRGARAQDPDFPAALDTVIAERLARTALLKAEVAKLWRELGVGTGS